MSRSVSSSVTRSTSGPPVATDPPVRPAGRRPTWRRVRRFVLPLAGLAVAAAFLSPYAVMLLDSLRPSSEVLATPPTFLPQHWQLGAYGDILGDERFRSWLRTSLVVALSSTVIVLLAAIPAAYFSARFRFPGRTAFLFLVLITQMFAPTSLIVGLYREFFEVNLVNTYLA
ncbi:MAG TPA: hypothetical protein VHN80_32230, partial [Kineosporiaceae bacterium]|nr:hypothetical protein [Kineosporiaceae bacterium]